MNRFKFLASIGALGVVPFLPKPALAKSSITYVLNTWQYMPDSKTTCQVVHSYTTLDEVYTFLPTTSTMVKSITVIKAGQSSRIDCTTVHLLAGDHLVINTNSGVTV